METKIKLSANMKEIVKRMINGERLLQSNATKMYYFHNGWHLKHQTILGLVTRKIIEPSFDTQLSLEYTLTEIGKTISI